MNRVVFTLNAGEDYIHWQSEDKRVVLKINKLIRAILSDPYDGIGKPEPLKHDLSGFWSRRIDREHRLVYRPTPAELQIIACRYHY